MVSDLNIFVWKWSKIANKKKLCYYPHRSRNALSPVCVFFLFKHKEQHQMKLSRAIQYCFSFQSNCQFSSSLACYIGSAWVPSHFPCGAFYLCVCVFVFCVFMYLYFFGFVLYFFVNPFLNWLSRWSFSSTSSRHLHS